ncbi:uncharacterized protein LOC62_02G002934 [Vanrija pseudolonga]|uniref:Ubiquitin-like domain-containing protein n=1 Tax=Vanrija pseudolonga TaxID=143232 RepID=A0AAF0Y4T8_9TREE|nr:hypothetical protein LOC62_02G002934 [Vanrija pseudolonga]
MSSPMEEDRDLHPRWGTPATPATPPKPDHTQAHARDYAALQTHLRHSYLFTPLREARGNTSYSANSSNTSKDEHKPRVEDRYAPAQASRNVAFRRVPQEPGHHYHGGERAMVDEELTPGAHPRPPRPDEFPINLQGSVDGRGTSIKYHTFPRQRVEGLKRWLHFKFGYRLEELRLVYDGRILHDRDTMEQLGVEAGDFIDIVLEPPAMPVTTRATAAAIAQVEAEAKPEPRSSSPPSSPAPGQSPKPDLADLKPTHLHTRTTEEHEDAPDDSIADTKPKIDGLEPERVDFQRVVIESETHAPQDAAREHKARERRQHNGKRTKIILQGSNDGRPYTSVVNCSGKNAIKMVKQDYINKKFGYGIPKLRLLYDGRILQDTDTVACLELEDGDVIDVYLEREEALWVMLTGPEIGGAAHIA